MAVSALSSARDATCIRDKQSFPAMHASEVTADVG